MGVDLQSTAQAVVQWRIPGRISLPAQPRSLFLHAGTGYLAGDWPDGAATVDGQPVPAQVRVLLRSSDPAIDGLLVAEVQAAPDGTWRVEGLRPGLRYDVVGRFGGHNDTIMADVTPAQ
ncbi:hypothetical protein E5198_00920 [Pseudomonas sp. A-1]|uniref:hypothetical protein n=1 Tax=Pseudomonas sp. A-1 TaxID=1821274 RepID=UPI0010A5D320|nr:hypothetical protein [Pseudomonas sp. A-1]THG87107.1 hypothetical protein E5198_00920 [Pseudomonas sp. A-1]